MNNNTTNSTHRRVQRSTTLNRKYVKSPEAKHVPISTPISVKVTPSSRPASSPQTSSRVPLSVQKPTKSPKSPTSTKNSSPSARDAAIDSALHSVSRMKSTEKSLKPRSVFTLKHIIIALICSSAVVAVIFFCANQSMPDLSLRVAAMQSGIDASYPSFVPREYSLTDIVSEDGKVEMTFTNGDGDTFTLTEENSSWDSSALEENYVKSRFHDYAPVREQGLTLFISGSDCVWVNGGKIYTIDSSGNNLTKRQLKSIAVSL